MKTNRNYEEMDLIVLPSSTLITEDNVAELNEKLKLTNEDWKKVGE